MKKLEQSFQEDTSLSQVGRAYLARCFADMLTEERRAAEGTDAEGVHQSRVAIRRMRTTLKMFSNLFPARAVSGFRKDLSLVAAALGAVRDLDIHAALVREHAGDLAVSDAGALDHYLGGLADERTRARTRLASVLNSSHHQNFKSRFARFLSSVPPDESAGRELAGEAAGTYVIVAAKRLRKNGEAIHAKSPDEELHRLRILGKRLRYVLEVFVPVIGKQLEPTIRRVTRLQDCLGAHHDACVAGARLRADAARVPLRSGNRSLLLVLGELVHVQKVASNRQRSAFFKLWPKISRELKPSRLRKKLRVG